MWNSGKNACFFGVINSVSFGKFMFQQPLEKYDNWGDATVSDILFLTYIQYKNFVYYDV